MGYLDQSTACDERRHEDCKGTVTIMDQDGPNAYVCKCSCHQRKAAELCKAEGHLVRAKLTQRCHCCGGEITFKPEKPVRKQAFR